MFKYLINDEVIIFNSAEERSAGLKDATANGYSIERLELDEDTDVSKAPDSAFGKLLKNEVPTEEDFLQDPAESADAVSETVAQDDTELPLEDTSLELPAVTKESVETLKEENSVISQEAAEDIFSADNNRIKEDLQLLAKNQEEFLAYIQKNTFLKINYGE